MSVLRTKLKKCLEAKFIELKKLYLFIKLNQGLNCLIILISRIKLIIFYLITITSHYN